ncbi:23193_t:CDS:2, partial [Cetraspora pellucida]
AEGSYPHYSILCYTLPPKEYPISDNYSIKTTWRREKKQQTIQCEIEYKDGKSRDKCMIKPAEQPSPKTLKRYTTELEIMIKENFIQSTKSKEGTKLPNMVEIPTEK